MLKYLYTKELFREIPSEITLGISLSGCKIHCPACNQKELWEDVGTPLDWPTLHSLIHIHQGITCLLLLGGEHDIDALTNLFYHAKRYVKTAWYCGLEEIPRNKRGILEYLDYVKIGSYKEELGGLDSPTTNQKLYARRENPNLALWEDITPKLWKHGNTKESSEG
jgi:anaerobic ribonucleoside-triphosphate reductase activating protein